MIAIMWTGAAQNTQRSCQQLQVPLFCQNSDMAPGLQQTGSKGGKGTGVETKLMSLRAVCTAVVPVTWPSPLSALNVVADDDPGKKTLTN